MSGRDELTLVEDLLARGVDDWVTAAEVIDLARRSGVSDPETLRALSVGLIAEVLIKGWMIAGEFDGTGHRPWECSTADAITRIAEDWFARSDPFVMPGEIVWLDCSDEGQSMGQDVLARKQT